MRNPGNRHADLDAQVARWRKRRERTSSLSARELDELQDHLRARADLLLETNAGLAPNRAFAIALDELGNSAELSAEFAKSGKPRWRMLLMMGWAMYAASFLLPVTMGQSYTALGPEPLTVRGWQAFLGSLFMVGASPDWLMKMSGLSNTLVLATFLKLRGKRPPRSTWFTCGVTAAALLNLYWGAADTDFVRVGYWAWVASFACIATALWMRAGEWASARAQTTAGASGA